MSGPFKMKGSSFYGHGNSSPAKITDEEKQANLLKAVPNKEAYDKLSDADKEGFDATGAKVGLPTKEVSPAKQGQRPDLGPTVDIRKKKDPSKVSEEKRTAKYTGPRSKGGLKPITKEEMERRVTAKKHRERP